MKTRSVIAVLLLVCMACTNNQPSESDKLQVTSEVKAVLNTVIKGVEEVNPELLTSVFLTTPEFTFQVNGQTGNYDQFTGAVKGYFSPLESQKIEMFNERYAILDKSTVLYSANSKCKVNFKDGKVVSEDPWALQFLFKKIDDVWKLASWTEYGSETILKAGSTPKQLDQEELFHQLIGMWQCNTKDNTFFWEVRPYGKSLTISTRTVVDGKTVNEETGVFAYDSLSDKVIQARVSKQAGALIAPMWFTSKNTMEVVFINDLQHPEAAVQKAYLELVSPTEFNFTIKRNDQVINETVYKLIRK